jgi:hypothetical protein
MSRQGNNFPEYPSYPYPSYPYPVYPSYPQPFNPYSPYPPGVYPPFAKPLKTDSMIQTESLPPSKKPENQFEFNQMYKKPLNSFEFSEFREKTLPMIRLNKLRKIQALVRGWFTRKYILPYKRRVQFYARRVMENLIEDYIEDNLLPEIILEIINTNFAYKDYSLYTPTFRLLMQIADSIENQVIHQLCEEAVKEITRFIVNDYLRKRDEVLIVNQQFDPLHRVNEDLIEIVLSQELKALVSQVVREGASDYLVETKALNILNTQFIPVYCREVINQAAWEIVQENIFNEILEFVIQQNNIDIITDSAEGEKDRIDLETLDRAFNGFLQRSIMKEAINELILMNQEYRDYEFRNEFVEKVSEDELSQFAMDDDFKPLKKGNDSGRSEIFINNSSISAGKASPGVQGSKARDFPRAGNELNKGVSPSKPQGKREVPENKASYEVPSGFTAPKSPRNKRHPVISDFPEANPVSHGRKGTKTYFPGDS